MDTPSAAPITHRRVLRAALPMVISSMTVPLLGAVDTGVVGQIGSAAPIGAVALGGVVLTGIYWIFGFLRLGTAGLAAQAHGAGDADESALILTRALLIAAAGGLILVVAQSPLIWAVLAMARGSDGVEALTEVYLALRILSAPAMIANFALTGWLIAVERTGAVLAMQLIISAVNAALSIWFVQGLGWGVAGVAVATVIAEVTGLLVGLWLCRSAFHGSAAWRRPARVFEARKLRRLAGVNADILVRSMCIQAVLIGFVAIGATFGDVTVAANQILFIFLTVSVSAMDGFAFTAEALVGQAFGAGQPRAVRRAAVLTSLWGAGVCAAMAGTFATLGPVIIDVMTTAEDVRAAAKADIVWMVLALLAGGPGWMLDGIFIGATRTASMRNAMLLSCLGCALSLGPALLLLGSDGLWAAFLVFFALRGVTLAIRYPALEAASRSAQTRRPAA
ncbi:MAG: MATE family efflux transporter [Pseudomonadota bacterium]